MRRKVILLVCVFCAISLFQSGQPVFNEYNNNPIFNPGKSYYPTVIFDPQHFGDIYKDCIPYYKMWYSSNAGIAMAYSEDGFSWIQYGLVSGLTSAHHACVIYDADGFGQSNVFYKIWYWDTTKLYSTDGLSIRYAESIDGINWTNDQGVFGGTAAYGWQRGSYGPADVLYNAQSTNTPGDPLSHTYVMYYDGTTGAFEQVGLAYSTDGISWTRYSTDEPVLKAGGWPNEPWGSTVSWDSSYVGFGTIVQLNGYHFFYSGGQLAMHEGIGYAFSQDGITWEKKGIIFHVTDNVGWRNSRCYTPSVLLTISGNRACFDMWFAGDDGSIRTIGYAQGCIPFSGRQQIPILQNTEREIQEQMVSLAQFNHEKCCEKYDKEINDILDSFDFEIDSPEYQKAQDYIDQAQYYCAKAVELTASGNAIAGNYCALQSCQLYNEALEILKSLAERE